MFYDSFGKICEVKGVTRTRAIKQIGISKGNLSNWKKGREPENEIKKSIVDFFGITIAELTEG